MGTGLRVHNVPHHTRLCVTSTHPGRLWTETKSSPGGCAEGRGERWFRSEKQTPGPKLALPNPRKAPILTDITCSLQNFENTYAHKFANEKSFSIMDAAGFPDGKKRPLTASKSSPSRSPSSARANGGCAGSSGSSQSQGERGPPPRVQREVCEHRCPHPPEGLCALPAVAF